MLQTDDFYAIANIYASSWKTAYKDIVPQDYLDKISENNWADKLRNSTSDAYILIENGKYIGTSSVCAARDEEMSGWGEIISIYLLPEYFGKGYGKPLFDNSVDALLDMGYNKIYVWVLEQNTRARKFYEKNGYKFSDKKFINIGGKDLPEMRYIKIFK